ncbi:MAG TPA: C4-type zinc ribbon domain-containing protein, partial [Pyrinomonadaceae bacterium]
MKAELQQLVALQNLDTRIRTLEKQLEAIPERRAEIEREFDQRAFEIRALETRKDEAKHTRARLENEAMEQKGRAERADRNLMSSKKQDEYTAAIREADAARKQISALETQILEQMEVSEQAESELKERADEIATLNSDRESRLSAFDAETSKQSEDLKSARLEREQLFGALPKAMSGLYARISKRIRDGVAVAEARNGACTACFMALRPQIMAEVRRGGEVITCDNCN